MFYWIIPYLLAYEGSETTDWKNGPIYTFEAQVHTSVLDVNHTSLYSNFNMLFTCRPTLDIGIMDCNVQNATIDNYEITEDSTEVSGRENATTYDYIFPIDFRVEFDANGVKNVTFSKPRGFFRESAIRSIIDNFNVGLDLSDKDLGHYVSIDKSINGECPTSWDTKIIPRQEDEVSIGENLDVAYMLTALPVNVSKEDTLLIEKDRKMHKCTKKTPYFFGSEESSMPDRKRGFQMDLHTTTSRSKIYLGKNRFNSYTENTGILHMGIKGQYIKNYERMKMIVKTSESIRVSLISIDVATDE